MTASGPASSTEWSPLLEPVATQQFIDSGWTAQDWSDLYQELMERAEGAVSVPSVSTLALRKWLLFPPARPKILICPALFQQTIGRYGHEHAAFVLNAYAAGASHRFVTAFLGRHPYDSTFGKPLVEAWEFAQRSGLDEPAATGWAMTGRLHVTPLPVPEVRWDSLPPKRKSVRRITDWTDPLGPAAYLWRLAGFTLWDALKAAGANGGLVSEQQLRVMVALNGVVLPEGV